MTKYKRKSEVNAIQWFKDGDHTHVEPMIGFEDDEICEDCKHKMNTEHGVLELNGFETIVCPGDYILDNSTVVKEYRFPNLYEEIKSKKELNIMQQDTTDVRLNFKEWYNANNKKFVKRKHLAQAAWQHIESEMLTETKDSLDWFHARIEKAYRSEKSLYHKLNDATTGRFRLILALIVSLVLNVAVTIIAVSL